MAQNRKNFSNVTYEASDDIPLMYLKKDLQRGINAYGLGSPAPIQQRALLPITHRRDVIVQSGSGTGKMGTFAISVLLNLDLTRREIQAICLMPTRETAAQVQKVILKLAEIGSVQCHALRGGKSIDTRKNFNEAHVVCGTPGRVLDFIKQRYLSTRGVRLVGFYQADEILNRGFEEHIYEFYKYLPNPAQVILFSTTLPNSVLDIAYKFMKDPLRIVVKRNEMTLDSVRQFFIAVEIEDWKFDILCDLYDTLTIKRAIIFCIDKAKVKWLAEQMTRAKFTVGAIHGDMSQVVRSEVMNKFRAWHSRVLITTDELLHCIVYDNVSLIINYDLPVNRELYIQRIGCNGYSGYKRVVVNFAKPDDVSLLRDIEKCYLTKIYEMPTNIADLI